MFYCNLMWTAMNLNLVEALDEDFIDLRNLNSKKFEDKIKVLAYYLGFNKNKQLSICYKCNGIAQYNDKIIPSAEQI